MNDESVSNLPPINDASGLRPRSLTSLAIYVALFFLVWSLRATVFIHIDESIKSSFWVNVYSNALKFIIWVVPVFITLRVWGLRPLTYTKLTTRVDKHGLIIGAIVVLVWLSIVVLVESAISHRSVRIMLFQRFFELPIILIGVLF